MRRLLALGVALAVALVAAPSARAATFGPCPRGDGVECASVSVPLDYQQPDVQRLGLHVERIRALGDRREGAVFALSGGPGQAATPLTEAYGFLLESALESRDLIVFDQRGTGRSGALRCNALDGPPRSNDHDRDERPGREDETRPAEPPVPEERFGPNNPIARCAEELGPRRAFYATQDSADDIESIRRELGVEKIALFGTSYGTKVALAYAHRYPDHVERMVLDSVVEPAGPDALSREVLEAVPRVLRRLCDRGCTGVSADPASDVALLVGRLAAGPLRGYRVGADGRRIPTELTREEMLAFLIAADFLPQARTIFPGAVRGALEGDLAPLIRLVVAAQAANSEPEPPEAFSQALYLSTICGEVSFPYERDASAEERADQALRAAERAPDEAFFPFDRETALRLGLVELCVNWPEAGRELDEVPTEGTLTDAPTLLVSGEEDLRTPYEAAQRTIAQLPAGALLSVPSVGHSVLGVAFDLCPGRVLERFFTQGTAGGRCPDERPLDPARPPAPLSIAQVPAARGVPGRSGRTLTSAALTLEDTLLAGFLSASPTEDPTTVVGGGLRSGRFRLSLAEGPPGAPPRVRLDLDEVGYVPGVRVSGRLRVNSDFRLVGRIRVRGRSAAPASLAARSTGTGYQLTGRVAGKPVRVRVRTAGR